MRRFSQRALPWVLMVAVLGVWTSRRLSSTSASRAGASAAEAPVLSDVPPFRLVAETGEPYGSEELAGQVWVANFIFTRCPTVCPKLTSRMADIQARILPVPGIHLVSFSVDPDFDSPEVLREYAGRYGADPARWTFLTGTAGSIQAAVEEGLKVSSGLDREKVDLSQVLHGTHFVLVDDRSRIRGYHDVATPDGFEELLAQATRLAAEIARAPGEASGDGT